MAETHLVLGAGAFSQAMVRALRARGEAVRVLTRRGATLGPEVEVRVGDAGSLPTVIEAARGAASIIVGASPLLSRWAQEFGAITDAAVEASGLHGVPLLMPGPLWSARPVPGVPLPTTLFDPDTLDQIIPAGRQRQWMELQIQQLSETRNVRTLLLRSSDWFGPAVRHGLLARSLASVQAGGPLLWFAAPQVPHDLVFVDDVAAVAVDALLRQDRPLFELLHVTGHRLDAPTLALTLGRVLGRSVPVRRVSSWTLALQGLLDPELRAWRQSVPIWEAALILDDTETRRRGFVPTPLEDALRQSLAGARLG